MFVKLRTWFEGYILVKFTSKFYFGQILLKFRYIDNILVFILRRACALFSEFILHPIVPLTTNMNTIYNIPVSAFLDSQCKRGQHTNFINHHVTIVPPWAFIPETIIRASPR